MNKRRYSTSSVLVYKHGLYGYRNICSPHACGVVIRATLLFDSDLRKAARANKKQQQLTGIFVVIVQGQRDKNHEPADRNYS